MLFTKEFIILEEGDGSKMDLKEIRGISLIQTDVINLLKLKKYW